ncbi:MFS transporter [Bacillus alkalicellulosilyticus]|uniref:MFS transporter n=1 Tax=Alkalihalobacterium alkalicellulosilyticum TaxID=1912214 RepID=UPI0009986220|nr:MFS transporter [Bacillus alkalicellulosilyticus]
MVRLSLFFFLLFSTFAITGALLPLYLQDIGLTTEQIGIHLAMGAVIAVLGQPFFGYVSDKIQSTKRVLIGVMIAALFVSFFYFSVTSFYMLLLLFILLNFFISASGPLVENITITFAQKNNKNYGVIRLWGDVGVGAAAVIIGALIGIYGVQSLGVMYAIILVVAIAFAFTLQDGRQKTTSTISVRSLKVLFTNKEYMWFLFLSMIIFITHRMNDSLFTVYISNKGASESDVGLAWMLATFASAPFFIIMGKLLSKYKELTLVLLAALVYCIRWLLYGVFDDPHILIFLQLLNGVTFPIFVVAALFFVTKIVPEQLKATGQTIFIAVIVGIAGLIGSAGGGWVMERFGGSITYQIGAGITFIGVILCAITLFHQARTKKLDIN